MTGGARRVGKALALALAKAGCDLVLHYRSSAAEAEETAIEAEALGVSVTLIQADLSRPDQAPSVFDIDGGPPISVLVNSAALFPEDRLVDVTADQWETTLAVNLRAPVFLTQAFARALPDGEEGAVVNVTDWRTSRPYRDHFSYTIAKGGLDTFTVTAAEALAPRIRVNAVALGAILPPPGRDSAYLKDLAKDLPLQRIGGVGAVVEAVLFVLRNHFVTGEIVRIDGGAHLR